jgi:hypothetical protein
MTDAKFAALERAYALGALSDDIYETARARLLEEVAAAPAAAPAPAPANREGDRAVAITGYPTASASSAARTTTPPASSRSGAFD